MSIVLSNETANKIYSLLEKEWGDSRDGDIENIFDILLEKEYALYGFKNKSGDIRFLWATDQDEAEDKFIYEVDDYDEYECFAVKDNKGKEVVRKVEG